MFSLKENTVLLPPPPSIGKSEIGRGWIANKEEKSKRILWGYLGHVVEGSAMGNCHLKGFLRD